MPMHEDEIQYLFKKEKSKTKTSQVFTKRSTNKIISHKKEIQTTVHILTTRYRCPKKTFSHSCRCCDKASHKFYQDVVVHNNFSEVLNLKFSHTIRGEALLSIVLSIVIRQRRVCVVESSYHATAKYQKVLCPRAHRAI